MERVAVIAGAGIAGLASALGLARAGWQVQVLERATALGEVGAGVALARNGLAALRGLGFDDDAIEGIGIGTRAGGTLQADGRPILTIDEAVDAVAMRGVHRAELHAALFQRAHAAGAEVRTGAAVTGVHVGDPDGDRAVVQAGGTEVVADLVVAADGVRSAVRAALDPALRPVYSGYSSWRAVLAQPAVPPVLLQYWGPHAEFGSMPVGADRTYWYGYVQLPEGHAEDDEHAAAAARFADWAPAVRELIAHTEPSAVMRHDVYHLPRGMNPYDRGRVVAVGDAAHAMLPTVGQGAATALEDGICVARLVGAAVMRGESFAESLVQYDEARRPRCRAIARTASASAAFGSHVGPRWQGLRNALMRHAPSGAISRGADAMMSWTPPD